MLNFIPLPYRLGAAALAVVAALGWFVWYRHSLIVEGEQKAITKIENANRESERKADEHQTNVDDCYAAGREWDRSRGLCLDASPGR